MEKFINQEHEKAYNLLLEKDYQQALNIFDDLIYLFPNEANLFSDRGVIFIHQNKKEAALKDFDQAVFLENTYGYRYASRAYARDFFGDTEAAILDYEKAIELDPEDSVSYNNIGLLQEKLGYQQKAQKNYDVADEISKTHEEILIPPPPDLENEVPKVQEESSIKNKSFFSEFLKVFKSKKQFREFIVFIKKGGKLK
jgi:tetratricopeptide (TPR) repeat protein